MIRTIASIGLAASLAGCASSMSGIGGTERYACKAPEGALCTSVSGVYANSVHGSPPASLVPPGKAPSTVFYGASPLLPAARVLSAPASAPMRSAPRVLRVWIAPWEDCDGDLHEEAVVRVVVDSGRWLIEHVRPMSARPIDAVHAPAATLTDFKSKPNAEAPASSEQRSLPPDGAIPISGATLQER